MNLENKSAILGAIWGVISIILVVMDAVSGGQSSDMFLKWKIIAFPAYFPDILLSGVSAELTTIGVIVVLVLPVLVGSLICYGLAKIYLKVK